jgi:hypothetical protein
MLDCAKEEEEEVEAFCQNGTEAIDKECEVLENHGRL